MTLRMDHVSVVVEDLEAAVAFFVELGMEVEGEGSVSGEWVDRVNNLDGVQAQIAMVRTPDAHNKLELTKFHSPALVDSSPAVPPSNTIGLRSVMFEVDDIDDAVARLQKRDGQLIGTIENYENVYGLCYVRGPADIIVALAEHIG